MSCLKWQIQILKWHERELDQKDEAALSRHLETCVDCRSTADNFSELDRLLLKSPEPVVPTFLNERIVSRVIEEMRLSPWKNSFHRFMASFAYFRPALAGMILVLGIGLGVLTGLNLSHSINLGSTASSYDLLSLAGPEDDASASSLDAIWTDTSGGGL
ncbi:MAG TPA: zf-HC2 domain-containing protein [Desulfomonilaceae bacterium]|nr:zf-HC2 domain-containing protein [Desulfomonilaceae bacterium]